MQSSENYYHFQKLSIKKLEYSKKRDKIEKERERDRMENIIIYLKIFNTILYYLYIFGAIYNFSYKFSFVNVHL